MPLENLNISKYSVPLSTAQIELNRLRDIEECAKIIHRDTSDGFLASTEVYKKLGELLTPPTDPDQPQLI